MVPQPISVVSPAPSRAARALMPLVLFCAGHFIVDLYSSALGTLQPLLGERFGLSFTQAGLLGGMLVFSSSTLQPIYGYLSDRYHSRLFAALAPGVTGLVIAALGWAPGFGWLLAGVFLGGAGIASFHPQGASNAVAGGGLARLPWTAIPGLLLTAVLLALMPAPAVRAHTRRGFDWEPLRAVWKPMTILFFLVFIRSVVQITFSQFLPLFLHTTRGYTVGAASLSLTLYLLGGTLGGLAGGALADRFGGRFVIIVSMGGAVPFLMLFLFARGPLSAVGLFLCGLMLLFTIPVNVVMAQELVPTQAGTVSALMMGFAWGTAGMIFIPLVGWFADLVSMQAAFAALLVFPVIGFLLALRLPR